MLLGVEHQTRLLRIVFEIANHGDARRLRIKAMMSSCCLGVSIRFGIVGCGLERNACSDISVVLGIFAIAAKSGAALRGVGG